MSLLQKFARRAKRLARHGLLAVPPVLAACRHLSSANGVTVFMYHDVGGDSPPAEAWQIVRRSDFMRQIDYVRGAYEIVSLDEALRRLSSGSHGSAPAAVIVKSSRDLKVGKRISFALVSDLERRRTASQWRSAVIWRIDDGCLHLTRT